MKDIMTAPFVREMCETTANMYRLGWDERNGGNISYLLKEEEVSEYLDLRNVLRVIPLMGVNEVDFDASPLEGKIFIVTGTGKYFKNVEKDPETNLGIVRIGKGGKNVELLWGYKDGGRPTSEFPAHMMSHIARLKVDPENRVVMHSHPTNTLAMNYVHELDEKKFTHSLWEMCTECIVVFPEGVGVLPWMLCSSSGRCTASTAQARRSTRRSASSRRWKRPRRSICSRRIFPASTPSRMRIWSSSSISSASITAKISSTFDKTAQMC